MNKKCNNGGYPQKQYKIIWKTLRGDKQEKTTLHNKQGYTEFTGQEYIDIVLWPNVDIDIAQ